MMPSGVLRRAVAIDWSIRQMMLTRKRVLAVLQGSIAGACGLAKTVRAGIVTPSLMWVKEVSILNI
jgi:hypothetical protein